MDTTPPVWASDLVERSCAFLGAVGRPNVLWHRKGRRPSTLTHSRPLTLPIAGTRYALAEISVGWCFEGRVEVWPGSLRWYQRLVLLHEIAHWHSDQAGHSAAYWDVAWRLYLRFMPRSLERVLSSESQYRTGALRAAVKAGVVGAKRALEDPRLRRAVEP